MKKTPFVLLITIMYCAIVSAQKLNADKIPPPVSTAFQSKYPGSTQEIWLIQKNNIYEVAFFYQKVRMSAEFDKTAQWLKTEFAITLTQLPAPVAAAIIKKIEGYKLIGTMERITAAKGTTYIVGIAKGSKKYEFHFSSTGKLMQKEAINQDDD